MLLWQLKALMTHPRKEKEVDIVVMLMMVLLAMSLVSVQQRYFVSHCPTVSQPEHEKGKQTTPRVFCGYFAGILHVFAKKTNMAAMSVSAVQVALLFVVGCWWRWW